MGPSLRLVTVSIPRILRGGIKRTVTYAVLRGERRHGTPQHSAAFRSTLQHPAASRGIPWLSAAFRQFRAVPQHSAAFRGIPWHSVAFRGIPWHSVAHSAAEEKQIAQEHKGPCKKMLTKTPLSTREAQRPMPEDADQDILEALVCLWPTARSNRAKLTCQGRGGDFRAWVGKIQFLFWQSFRWLFSVQLQSFLGPILPAKDLESN